MTDTAYEGYSWNASGSTTGAPTVITYAWGDTSTSTYATSMHFTSSITGAYQALVQAAMQAWEAVANVTFQLQASTSGAKIDIGWENYTTANQLGETDYAGYTAANSRSIFVAGMFVGFEDPSIRSVGSDQTSTYAGFNTTLYEVILHELGHALGLAHSTNSNALMYPTLGRTNNGISQYDIAGVQQLYGSAMVAAPLTPATPMLAAAINGESNRGDLTLSGTAVAGDTVTLIDISTATPTAVATAVADSNGAWSVHLTGVADGAHSYKVTDTGTNGATSGASSVLTFVVDTVTPDAPRIVGATTTRLSNPTIRGVAEAGTTVTVMDGATTLGTALVGQNGLWSLATAALAEGAHPISATTTDLVGHVSAASTILALTVDTIAPIAPDAPALATSGTLLNDAPIALVGTGAEPLGTITLFDGSRAVGLAQVDASGSWSASVRIDSGQHALTATETDSAGNVSPASASLAITVATPTPVAITAAPQTQTQTSTVQPQTVNVVYRFFDLRHGTQFLTANATERDSIIATRPDLSYEGKAMGSVNADPNDPNIASVFRFFDTTNGTHFFSTSTSERDGLVANRHDLVLEQVNLFEHATQRAGDVPVFRFFNTADGSHFYTPNVSEQAEIVKTRPDMIAEGVAFYAPST